MDPHSNWRLLLKGLHTIKKGTPSSLSSPSTQAATTWLSPLSEVAKTRAWSYMSQIRFAREASSCIRALGSRRGAKKLL